MPRRPMLRPFFVLILCVSVAGCATAPAPAPPTTAPAPEAVETEESAGLPPSLHWVRSSAEHDAIYHQVYAWAGQRLEELVAGKEAGTWAVSLDADETVIDNSLYQKERWDETHDLSKLYTKESWIAWVEREEAPPLPGVLDFLEKVREMGGVIAIVTNRDQPQCPETEENFRKEGIPYDIMLCQTGTGEKEPRWDRVEDGTASTAYGPLEIVLWIGDNIGDFPGQTQELRFEDPSAFAPFGEIYFNLPNPMYGSWEDNPAQ